MCGLPSTRNIFFFLAILSFPNVVKIDIYDLWLVVRLYCVFSNKGLHFDSKFYYLLLHLSALKPRQTTLIIQHIINVAFKYDIMCYGTVTILQICFCSMYTSALQDVFLIEFKHMTWMSYPCMNYSSCICVQAA